MSVNASNAGNFGKVGSDPSAAENFAGGADFGIPETGHENERAYVSAETRANDPGRLTEQSGASTDRVAGVGGRNSGPGSASGGDVDADFSILGSVSQAGPDDRKDGADMHSSDESVSDRFGAKSPDNRFATNSSRAASTSPRQHSAGEFVDHSGGDAATTNSGQGAGATTNAARNDDSFSSEISSGEASGADN